MRWTLTGSDIAVVAQFTGIDHRCVAKTSHRPIIGGMANITGRGSRYVGSMLSGGDITVMA
jgi:hypothetical protein